MVARVPCSHARTRGGKRGAEKLAGRLVEILSGAISDRRKVGCYRMLSIGMSSRPGMGRGDELLKNADLAIYNAKNERRPMLRVYERKLKTEADSRQCVETDLRRP